MGSVGGNVERFLVNSIKKGFSKKWKRGHAYARHFTFTMLCISYNNPARKHRHLCLYIKV